MINFYFGKFLTHTIYMIIEYSKDTITLVFNYFHTTILHFRLRYTIVI